MTKRPWEEEAVNNSEIKTGRRTKGSVTNTPLLTVSLSIFFVIMVAILFAASYTSNRGGGKASETPNFCSASSSSVVSLSSEASLSEATAETTTNELSTDANSDDTAESSNSTGSSDAITISSGEGAASITVRVGTSIETLYELNPGHMISGYWYADPGNEVYIS